MRHRRDNIALVAGGAGFIGSHLVDALIGGGHRVIVIDNFQTGRLENLRHLEREPRVDVLEATDVVDPLPSCLFRSNMKLDRIYNLACAASPVHYQADPEHTMLSNVLGTGHLLRLAQHSSARFFLASTSEIYGDPEVHPQTETYWGHVNSTGPRACYDEGKRAAETLTFDFARSGRADVRVVRIFNTYGPRMRPDDGRVVSNVINQAINGEDITVYGSGQQTRSFCYVDDLVDGILRVMEHARGDLGAVNLGNPYELTVCDLVARVLRLTKSNSRVVERPLPIDDPQRRRPNIDRAMKLLEWHPKVTLERGLKRTIAYFEQEKDARSERSSRPLQASLDVNVPA